MFIAAPRHASGSHATGRLHRLATGFQGLAKLAQLLQGAPLRLKRLADATPAEADLPRFIDLSKEFNGKAAMEATGIRAKCVTVLIDGPEDADPWGREVLYNGETRTGRLTSGGYSVAFGKSIGMGYVKPEDAVVGTRLKVKMLDQLWEAEVVEDSPYDPKNQRIRADG